MPFTFNPITFSQLIVNKYNSLNNAINYQKRLLTPLTTIFPFISSPMGKCATVNNGLTRWKIFPRNTSLRFALSLSINCCNQRITPNVKQSLLGVCTASATARDSIQLPSHEHDQIVRAWLITVSMPHNE